MSAMSNVVSVVDYGSAGNIESIRKAIIAAGAEVRVISRPADVLAAKRVVLPGVGSFSEGMMQIHERGMFEAVRRVAEDRPVLGICLGMQLLADVGYEFGETAGLGLVEGEVRPVVCKAAVPHIGFKPVRRVGDAPIFAGIEADAEFYFMHSYEFVNFTDVAGLTTHGGHSFVAAVARGNVFGVQFHPEKSRDAGIRLLKNFVGL